MKIKVYVKNIALDEPQTKEYDVNINHSMSVQDLLDMLKCSVADLSDYYEYSGVFAWNNGYLPFIISDDKLMYNVSYSEVNLMDFMNTQHISDNSIRVTTGYAQAGGPGFIELEEIWEAFCMVWEAVKPYLEEMIIVTTLSGISVKDIFKGLRTYFTKKKTTPHAVVDMLSSRKQWNHKELASYLGVEDTYAKHLLLAFGYKYDRKLMQYVPGEKTEELKEKLENIQVHDI